MMELCSVEPDKLFHIFNDAKCDRMERPWTGILGLDNVLLKKCKICTSLMEFHDISKCVQLNLILQITLMNVFICHLLVFI